MNRFKRLAIAIFVLLLCYTANNLYNNASSGKGGMGTMAMGSGGMGGGTSGNGMGNSPSMSYFTSTISTFTIGLSVTF